MDGENCSIYAGFSVELVGRPPLLLLARLIALSNENGSRGKQCRALLKRAAHSAGSATVIPRGLPPSMGSFVRALIGWQQK
jgi:hypothetical protein